MTDAPETIERPRGFFAWPRPLRWTTYVAVVVALALVVGLVTATVMVRRSWPQTAGELEVAGLQGEVTVVRDDHGIPQIYADSMHDMVLAQGYVHAQERFYEMDVRRHATAGRLAEMFGESAVETDLVVRTLGWRRVAEREVAMLAPETRDLLDAYAEGVNAYLSDHSPSEISLEYLLLDLGGTDVHIEPWTPVDSVAWLKAMAWDLRGNLTEELGRAQTIAAVGSDRAEQLFPPYPYDAHAPIVDQGAVVDEVFEQDATSGSSRLPQRPAPGITEALARTGAVVDAVPDLIGDGDGVGSNSWVVSGEHTESGAPILANDPHLGVSLPGIWTQVGLHCRTVDAECPLDVAGFSFSGVPGVVIGHNDRIAWGFTNFGADVTDLYVERIEGDTWRHAGESLPLEARSETIEVAGGDPIEITVRSTDHGPILSDLADRVALGDRAAAVLDDDVVEEQGDDAEYAVSLAWTALDPQPTLDALFALNTATEWQSFRAALADFAVPGQNVVYADSEGHIGYQATGRVPIRKSGTRGLLPAAGWQSENDWTGDYVPYDALPRLFDPEPGVIAAANQAAAPRDYPYYLTRDWARGYRSQRINELLEEGRFSVEDMARLQVDEAHPMAAVLVPRLLAAELPTAYDAAGQELLEDWDGVASADSAAAAYFNAVWRQLLARTFHDELPEDLWPDGGQRWYAAVHGLLTDVDDPWWDDVETEEVQEDRDQIIADALMAARDELTARLSPNVEDWAWGELHELELRSSTLGESGIGLVESIFNRGGWEIGGGSSLVNATSWDATEGFGVTTGPSMRMVVPTDDFDASRWINLSGVSGHAFHGHYTDQTDLFVEGETLPWPFTEDAVEAAAEDTLTLSPSE